MELDVFLKNKYKVRTLNIGGEALSDLTPVSLSEYLKCRLCSRV